MYYKRILKRVAQVVGIFILTFSMLGASCNKLKNAVDAAPRLAAQVGNLQDSVESSYNTGKIDKELALKLSKLVKDKLNVAVGKYTDFIDQLVKAYPKGKDAAGNKIPASQWEIAQSLFRVVEDSAREILVALGALTPNQSATIGLAIDTFFALLAIIRAGFAEVEKNYQDYIEGEPSWATA